MKKQSVNPYDHWFETFLNVFKGVKNFHLLAQDPSSFEVIHLLTEKTMELHSLERLYKTKMLPFLNEDRVTNQQSFRASKYAHLIKVDPKAFSEVDEWVRVGYTLLFHKYEGFLHHLLPIIDRSFEKVLKSTQSINAYVKATYGFEVQEQWRLNDTIWECNYIAVSAKHYDGKPKQFKPEHQIAKPLRFRYLDPTKRISIAPQQFFKDIERVRKFLSSFTTTLLLVQMARLGQQMVDSDLVAKADPELKLNLMVANLQMQSIIDSTMAHAKHRVVASGGKTFPIVRS